MVMQNKTDSQQAKGEEPKCRRCEGRGIIYFSGDHGERPPPPETCPNCKGSGFAYPSPASAPGAEPVAWRWKAKDRTHWWLSSEKPTDAVAAAEREGLTVDVQPLYAATPADQAPTPALDAATVERALSLLTDLRNDTWDIHRKHQIDEILTALQPIGQTNPQAVADQAPTPAFDAATVERCISVVTQHHIRTDFATQTDFENCISALRALQSTDKEASNG